MKPPHPQHERLPASGNCTMNSRVGKCGTSADVVSMLVLPIDPVASQEMDEYMADLRAKAPKKVIIPAPTGNPRPVPPSAGD